MLALEEPSKSDQPKLIISAMLIGAVAGPTSEKAASSRIAEPRCPDTEGIDAMQDEMTIAVFNKK